MSLKKIIPLLFVAIIMSNDLYAIENLGDIKVGGIYRMELTTGDVLEGIIEEKNDSSLIIESQGTPYKFNKYLITTFTLLSPPKTKKVKKVNSGNRPEALSYEELLHRKHPLGKIFIRLVSGAEFKGVISEIDTSKVKLNIDGSIITITRNIIAHISTIVPKTKSKTKGVNNKSMSPSYSGPFDTIFIVNPETDEWGDPLAPLLVDGIIEAEESGTIKITLPDNSTKNIKRDQIIRIIRHSEPSYDRQIKTYAKPLFCPKNMILIDLPPGQEGRPFFKVCIDKYEFPNRKGVIPQNNISYNNAMNACMKVGKRLCTVDEWQWSCSGLEGITYPYGYNLDKEKCNREGNKNIEPSGRRFKCISKFGVYDMVGNIFEWVTSAEGKPMVMGGPFSKCQTKSPGMSGTAKPSVGFRCCKSN